MQKVCPDAKGIVKKDCCSRSGFILRSFKARGRIFCCQSHVAQRGVQTKGDIMQNRIALIGIVVNEESSVEPLNKILHDYKDNIVGRMGIPYRSRGVNLISVVIDAPNDSISALTGKIGMLSGVTAKALYSKVD